MITARLSRRHALALGLAAAATPRDAMAQPRTATLTGPLAIPVNAKPLNGFLSRDPERRRFGALDFIGGLELSSPFKDFGGISSLRVNRDGERFLSITDRGNWLRGRIRYAGDVPAGIADAVMAPILGPDGRPITTRRWYDTEALAEDDGIAYIAIERVHRVLWFDIGRDDLAARGQLLRTPPEVSRLPSNKGIEGMVVAPKGSALAGTLIAVSERGLDEAGNVRGFLIGGPTPGLFGVRRSDDFDLTDLALLPQGDLLILERSFSLLRGAGMRIRRIPIGSVRPGAVLDGPVLIQADSGYHIDNMEGLSVHQRGNGDVVLTIVSDDNFSRLQRTLLLQFKLATE